MPKKGRGGSGRRGGGGGRRGGGGGRRGGGGGRRGGGRSQGSGDGRGPGIQFRESVACGNGGHSGGEELTINDLKNLSLGSVTPLSASTSTQQQKPATPVTVESNQVAPLLEKPIIALRTDFGKTGELCALTSNHFQVRLGAEIPFQYDITISPKVWSKRRQQRIFKTFNDLYKESKLKNMMLAFDGKNAFSVHSLPFDSEEFCLTFEENGRRTEYTVFLRLVATKNPLQAYNVVLRDTASQGRERVGTMMGRSLFFTDLGEGDLGGGLIFRNGFFQSLRHTQMGLSLNLDKCASTLYDTVLVSEFARRFLEKEIRGRPLTGQDFIKLGKVLKGVRVDLIHQGYKKCYKIKSLTKKPINELTFFASNIGKTQSVVDYFRQRYKITLQYQRLPAIQAGTDKKPIYLPMEICRISDEQRYIRSMNNAQLQEFRRVHVQHPMVRKATIERAIRSNKYNDNPLPTHFGLQINEDMTCIIGRTLEPPSLIYQDEIVHPSCGKWNTRGLKFIEPGTVSHWATMNMSHKNVEVENFLKSLITMCRMKGMDFAADPLIKTYTSFPENLEGDLAHIKSECTKAAPEKGIQLLFIILPDGRIDYHSQVKKTCETKLGIISQCIKSQTLTRFNENYLESIARKINVKVGCRNTEVAAFKGRSRIAERLTMIIGADVTHVPPGDGSKFSIAAVVASMDFPEVTKYRALVSTQPAGRELLDNLYTHSWNGGIEEHSGMIRDHMISFKERNGNYPDRIIFYRDGVGDGQFEHVLIHEKLQIEKACWSLEPSYKPPLTIIIAQKRHHTRFFPAQGWPTDSNGNVLPGTVVDTNICHPTLFDFYLCSHAAIQGTSRPTRYTVILDENNFTSDDIQYLTNSLCYTYQRCTRAVSLVPPVYYAHLAASRARYLNTGEDSEILDNVKEVMYYC